MNFPENTRSGIEKANIARAENFQIRKDRYIENPVLCLYCKEPLRYEKRHHKFCNHSCAASYTNIGRARVEQKTCASCGSIILDSKKDYCNRQCSSNAKIQSWLSNNKYPNTEIVPLWIRNYLLKLFENQCEVCNWRMINPISGTVPLAVHHIDGNPKNHDRSNLKLLCPNCHSITSTFGSLNKGNGRSKRYKTI